MNKSMTKEEVLIYALKNRLRWTTDVGSYSLEDLWELPLEDKNGAPNLVEMAIQLSQKLEKKNKKPSFLEKFSKQLKSKKDKELEIKLKILETVIESKIEDSNKKAEKEKLIKQKEKLEKLIENKKEKELEEADVKSLQEMLDEINFKLEE